MFENPGGKLRWIAIWFFIIAMIGAVGMVVGSFFFFESGGWILLISAVAEAFVAWVSTVAMLALADAAEGAVEAAEKATELIQMLGEKEHKVEATIKKTEKIETIAVNPDGKLPAWQRVEMEKKTSDTAGTNVAKDQAIVATEVSETEIVCPKCGTKQGKGRRVCWSCGQKFE